MLLMVLVGSLAFYLGVAGAVKEGAGPGALPSLGAPAEPAPAVPQEVVETGAPVEAGERDAAPAQLAQAAEALQRAASPAAPARVEPSPTRPAPAPATRGRVAVVIDDCGQDFERDSGFFELEAPLTLAVLPHLPDSRLVAEAASARGLCVLLHLPMEGSGGRDPGPGALRAGMGDEELQRTARGSFDAVPGIAGFNNHEGSLGSADPRLVGVALAEAEGRGLFVLDSRTTSGTVLAREAGLRGLPVRSRDVFLDNDDDVDRILAQIDRLRDVALSRGTAVALGHPRAATLEALRRGLPRLEEAGVQVVPLAELVQGRAPRAQS